MNARFLGAFLAAGVVTVAAAQQTPVFRAGVEILAIDVVALDKSGAPVTGLTAADFTVTTGKKLRRVVTADFINSSRPAGAASAQEIPAPSSTSRVILPRTLLFVIDTDQISSGGGRQALKGMGDYLDRLLPDDRVGVMTLLDTRVPPTVNRSAVREALSKLVGTSSGVRDKEMTYGEAVGISVRDRAALQAFWYRVADQGYALPGDRTCSPPQGFESVQTVSPVCVQAAEVALERARHHTRRVLSRLGLIADALTDAPDPKALILVSGGVLSDASTRNDVTRLAMITEASRVAVHAILLDGEASAGRSNSTQTQRLDSSAGYAGLADITLATRGSVQRVFGESTNAMSRVDRELSAHYVISFERDPGERVGEREDLDVRVNRPGVTVSARKGFTPPPANAAAAPRPISDPKAAIAALLKRAPVTQLPVDADVFALPVSAAGSDARVVVALEAARDPSAIAAVGFMLADADGKVLADGYELPDRLQKKGDGRSLFITTVPLKTGRYIARFAVVDTQGLGGSVQHTFEIAPWPDGPIRLSDLMLGDSAADGFRPGTSGAGTGGNVDIRLVVRDTSAAFSGVRVRAVVTRSADDSVVQSIDVPLTATPDPLRRFADAVIPASKYPAGEYVVSATVTAPGTEMVRRRRFVK